MDQLTRALVEGMAAVFEPDGPVVEIGSRRVQDVAYWDLRPLFPGRTYVGCDMEPGTGVDCLQRIEALSLADGAAGTVLCLNVAEHVYRIFDGVRELHRITAPGGTALVVTVFNLDIHGFPGDYWRFTPTALLRLMDPFESVLYGWQGHPKSPRLVFALGRKGPIEDPASAAAAWRRETLARWTEHPTAWKRIGAGLGAALFGKRYFRNIRHWWNLEMVAAHGDTEGR